MPYVGLVNNKRVGPYQVSTDTEVLCPACETRMSVRKSHYNQDNLIPRHFYHIDKSDCGGESDTHKRMKTLAMYYLRDQFPNANVELEKSIGDRFADVCATFDEPRKPYGKGLVVEAQFKNKDKDTADAQWDFFDHGYSVYWAYLSDIEDMKQMEFTDHRMNTIWPNKLPKRTGLEGYSEAYQTVHSRQPGEVSKEIKVPIEYYKDHLFDIYSPKHITSKGWKLSDEAWLHSKGGEIAWFNLYETEFDVPILEFRKRDKNKNTTDHLHMDINENDVDRVKSFIKEVSKAVNQSDTYENGNKWKTAASVWIEGLRPNTRGRITLAKPPGGRLRLLLVREDRNQNTTSTSIEWRKGDTGRLENDLYDMLERNIS